MYAFEPTRHSPEQPQPKKYMPVMGDGFCFLNTSIYLLLYCNYDKFVTVDHIPNNNLEHPAANADDCKQFHTGDLLISDREGYF